VGKATTALLSITPADKLQVARNTYLEATTSCGSSGAWWRYPEGQPVHAALSRHPVGNEMSHICLYGAPAGAASAASGQFL
jgi:hypothetical protein